MSRDQTRARIPGKGSESSKSLPCNTFGFVVADGDLIVLAFGTAETVPENPAPRSLPFGAPGRLRGGSISAGGVPVSCREYGWSPALCVGQTIERGSGADGFVGNGTVYW